MIAPVTEAYHCQVRLVFGERFCTNCKKDAGVQQVYMPMQKEQIIQTAITILDRDGLEGVTLRRLAKELGVKAASIYWHIASKEVLLDEMANAMLKEHFADLDFGNDQRDWAAWLDTLARRLRIAMLAHREGARVVAGAHPNVALMLIKLIDLSLRILLHAGFNYTGALTTTTTVITFTFGFVIEEQASPPWGPESDDPLEALLPEAPLYVEAFPTLAVVMEAVKHENNDTRFDTGIRIIINGVRAELHSSHVNAG